MTSSIFQSQQGTADCQELIMQHSIMRLTRSAGRHTTIHQVSRIRPVVIYTCMVECKRSRTILMHEDNQRSE